MELVPQNRYSLLGTVALTCSVASFYPGLGIAIGAVAVIVGRVCLRVPEQKTRAKYTIAIAGIGIVTNLVLLSLAYLASFAIDR